METMDKGEYCRGYWFFILQYLPTFGFCHIPSKGLEQNNKIKRIGLIMVIS